MGELKNRTYLNTIVKIKIAELARKLSTDTRIPLSRLADEAWEDLLKKYGIEVYEEEPTDD